MTTYLESTQLFDYEHPAVQSFVEEATAADVLGQRDRAVALYYAVRDTVHYEVFGASLSDAGLKASAVATGKEGFCLHKSILYVAACRSVGVPARVVSGHVRNHLSTPELRRLVGGEVFLHWLTEVQLDGRWVKATPVFSALMCRLYGMQPLDFNGVDDSLHHPYDDSAGTTMQFLDGLTVHHDLTAARARGATATDHPRMLGPGESVPTKRALKQQAESPGTDPRHEMKEHA